jgi:predicted glycoside hydrolase/deacetylase ChbG (UPF0249 family)
MVFMSDSKRAAEIAKIAGLDAGLHLNLTQHFTYASHCSLLSQYHARIRAFLTNNRYSVVIYHPFLRREFQYVIQAQLDEFQQLYGKPPTHVDGHQHKHLCSNVIFSDSIPSGQRLRRNFTFCAGEKHIVNRSYRCLVDKWLARRYVLTDFFFSLTEALRANTIARVANLAKRATVELMTHPELPVERNFLMSDTFSQMLASPVLGTYACLHKCPSKQCVTS